MNSSSNRGVYCLLDDTSSLTIKRLALDDQTDEFNYRFLIINSYGCVNSLFPFIYYNASSNQYVCYSTCPTMTWGQFQQSLNANICLSCGNNCLTCINSTACINCSFGYELNVSLGCILNSSYFINSTGIFLCANKILNCSTCVSDGLMCSNCVMGFTINSSNCISCN